MTFRQIATLGFVLFPLMCLNIDRNCHAQTELASKGERGENGLYTLVTPRLTLISDLPFDAEVKSWPGLLEQSMEQWSKYFHVDLAVMADWKIKAVLMKDRERFVQLGMLDGVPAFDEGYQFGNEVYLREQPTVYYRRLLFLHEATHWIIWRLYGGGGPSWFMEGMAEMQGTHALQDGLLQLGVIPASRELVAGWGRLRLINDSLKQATAPSISEIFAFGNAREDHEVRYAWSWAACVFFTNHPKYGPILKELYSKGKLDYSDALSLKFRKQLEPDWAALQREWNAFISDLDFGYDFSRSALIETRGLGNQWQQGLPARMQLETDRGWQQTGIVVKAGEPIRVSCFGSYELNGASAMPATPWVVDPCGITYQYYRGNPLGCVLGSIVPDEPNESTKRWETFRVGNGIVVDTPKSGKLFLKINEASNGLRDNKGQISVEISVTNP